MPPHPAASRGSTTEPDTPEPPPVNVDDEEIPNGDFARLAPISRPARIAFHDLYLAIEQSPEKYQWHRKYLHFRQNLEELEPEIDEQSTSDELARSPRPRDPTLIHTGFWRLNMDLHPANRQLGWVMGKGRWNTRDSSSSSSTGGGVDILLTANIKDPALRGRHSRLLHSLESHTLMLIADKRLRVGEKQLNPTNVAVFGQRKTAIAFGDLEYELSFTDIDQSLYRAQLDQLAQLLNYQGHRPGLFLDPTPAETDYMIMNKYFIRSSFTQGSTCWICAAVDKDTGASVAVKKTVAVSSRTLRHARREIDAMGRLLVEHAPPTVAKLIDSIIIEPSSSSGATECFIISQPLISGTLGQVLTSQSLPMTSRLSLFEQMLEGLAFLHAEGCMHRDIKPDNILASCSPLRAVIIDFGCATWDKTSEDHVKGTIRYLAPEIIALKENTAARNSSYDMSADVWSMGLTAYELLCGSRARFSRISWKFYDEELLSTIGVTSALGSDEVKWAFGLVKEMLRWDPKSRIQSEQAVQKCPTYKAQMEQRQLKLGKREHSGMFSTDSLVEFND